MKYIRGILGGVIFGIVSILTAWLTYDVLSLNSANQISQLWRPKDSWQVTTLIPVTHIVMGLLTSLSFAILYKGIPGRGIIKGLSLGLILSFAIWLPDEIFWYGISPISIVLPMVGWLQHLFASVIGCSIIALVYGKSLGINKG